MSGHQYETCDDDDDDDDDVHQVNERRCLVTMVHRRMVMVMMVLMFQVNGRHCLGWELTSVQHLLDNAQGEVMLGIARKKEEQIDVSVGFLKTTSL